MFNQGSDMGTCILKDHSRHYVQNGGHDPVQIHVEKAVRRQLEEID